MLTQHFMRKVFVLTGERRACSTTTSHPSPPATCHMAWATSLSLSRCPDPSDCHLPTLRWRVAFPMKRVWISLVSGLPFPGPMHSTSAGPRGLSVNAKTSVLCVCLSVYLQTTYTHRCCLIGSVSVRCAKLKEILFIAM